MRELEIRKQKEMELLYEKERMQLREDEKWAIKNVQEKLDYEQRMAGIDEEVENQFLDEFFHPQMRAT